MSKIVFLLEEHSMQVLLEGLLPRIFPELVFQCVPHSGKSELEKSIPIKLKDWREPGVRFVIMCDKDKDDCVAVKERLRRLCVESGKPDALVRIVCEELEAWYIAEPSALAEAYGDERLRKIGRGARFRHPDAVRQPSETLSKRVPGFRKTDAARRMAQYLSRERNISPSFQALLTGLDRLIMQTRSCS